MGKAPAKPAKAKPGPTPDRRNKGTKGKPAAASSDRPLISPTNRIILILVGIAFVPFCLPTLLLLFVGMLPTLAAVAAERGTARQAWVSVGGLNFAGLSNWLLNLWFGHHTWSYAVAELLTVTPLVVAYVSSALGWALYLAMPPLVNAVTAVTSQRRVVALSAQQRKLVEQWGDGVVIKETPTKPTASATASPSSAPAGGSA